MTQIYIFKKRFGDPKDVRISFSSSGPGAGSPGYSTLCLDVEGKDVTKIRLDLSPEDARYVAKHLLDGADFAENAECKCGHGKVAHHGRLGKGWNSEGCSAVNCECEKFERR